MQSLLGLFYVQLFQNLSDISGFFMLSKLFNPKTIAVVGASNKPGKIGYTIMRNLLHNSRARQLFPINIDSPKILGLRAYKKVSDIPIKKLDLLVIAVPKASVLNVLKDSAKKNTKFAVIISSGFKEAGDLQTEEAIIKFAKRNKIRIIGPNVLGVYSADSGLDTLFLSLTAQPRPKLGKISLISQSGTVGAILMFEFEKNKIGLNKFISYGNASDINECDLINALNKDENTDVICAYIEEIIDGKRFIDLMRRQKKPIIMLKAGKSKKGSQSVKSHTGNLAGDSSVYSGIMKQFNIIDAETVNDLVNYAKVQGLKQIRDVTIITNGGGYGILLSDHLEQYGVPIKDLSSKLKTNLKKNLPFGVSVRNPIDIMGDADADRYIDAIRLTKRETDTYIIILLGQVSTIDRENVQKLYNYCTTLNKNIIFISTEDEYTKLLENKYLVFQYPQSLARALKIKLKSKP